MSRCSRWTIRAPNGSKTFPLPHHALGPAFLKYGYTRRLVPWLRQHAPEFDLVVVNGVWQYTSFAVWRALRDTKTPYVVFTHGMLDPWFKRQLSAEAREEMAVLAVGRIPRAARRDRRPLHLRGRETARAAFVLAVPLQRDGHQLRHGGAACRRRGVGRSLPARVSLRRRQAHHPVPRPHPREERVRAADSCVRIDACGTHRRRRRSLHLVFAGPDSNCRLPSLAGAADQQDVSLRARSPGPGLLTGDLKWGAFRAADVFALTSHQENFGIAVAEALACGLPVLLSNQVNIWREIEEDSAGFIENDDEAGARASAAALDGARRSRTVRDAGQRQPMFLGALRRPAHLGPARRDAAGGDRVTAQTTPPAVYRGSRSTFSFGNRAARQLWNLVWLLLVPADAPPLPRLAPLPAASVRRADRPRRARLRRRENLGALEPRARRGRRPSRTAPTSTTPTGSRSATTPWCPRARTCAARATTTSPGTFRSSPRRSSSARARLDCRPRHRPHGRDGRRGLRDRVRQRGDARHAGVDRVRRRAVPSDSAICETVIACACCSCRRVSARTAASRRSCSPSPTPSGGIPRFEVRVCFKRVAQFSLQPALEQYCQAAHVEFCDRASRELWSAIGWADVVHAQNASPDVSMIAALLRKPLALTIHDFLPPTPWAAARCRGRPARAPHPRDGTTREPCGAPGSRTATSRPAPACRPCRDSSRRRPSRRREEGFCSSGGSSTARVWRCCSTRITAPALDPADWPLTIVGEGPAAPRARGARRARGLAGRSLSGFCRRRNEGAAAGVREMAGGAVARA